MSAPSALRLEHGVDVAADVVGAERILDGAAVTDLVEVAEAGAVLGDQHRRVAVFVVNAHQEPVAARRAGPGR